MSTVLVVEDSPVQADALAAYLTEHGLDVLVVADGSAGWEMIRDQHSELDAVVLDIQLPGLTGVQIARRIHESISSPPPVIMLTTHGDGSIEELAWQQGIVEFVEKGRHAFISVLMALYTAGVVGEAAV